MNEDDKVEEQYHELRDAVAEVGRIIEALPRHERHHQLRRVFDEYDEDYRMNIMMGTFVVAHDMRLGLGPSRAWPIAEDES